MASFLDESSFEALFPPDKDAGIAPANGTIAEGGTPLGHGLPHGSPTQRRQHRMTSPLPAWRGMVPGSAPRAAADEATVARLQCQCDLAHVYDRLLSKAFTERTLRSAKNGRASAMDEMDANDSGQSSLLHDMAIAVRVRTIVFVSPCT